MKRLLGASVLVMALLPACSTLESLQQEVLAPAPAPGSETASGESGESSAAHEDPPPAPKRKPEVAPETPRTARAMPPEAAPDQTFEPNPRLLVGLDFDATKALLGDPALQSEQPPAKVWAYNAGDCMFNVFFYPSVEDNVFRVLTYAVTGMAESQTASTAPAPPAPVAPAPAPDTATSTAPASPLEAEDSAAVRRCFAKLLDNRGAPTSG